MSEELLAENAAVLDDLAAQGVDLAIAREVDFTAVFVDEAAAERFAERAAAEGFAVGIERTDCVEGLPWDVIATRELVPSADVITGDEVLLGALAAAEGGRTDGWGFAG